MSDIFDKVSKGEKKGDIFDGLKYTPTKEFKKEDFPQLEPTPWEEAQKIALPLALDIAGSVVAPQFAIPHGLGTLATIGRRGVNLLSRMGGSAAGAGGGEYLSQMISGEELDPQEAGKKALIGATGELAFAPMGAAGKALAKPLFPLFSKITFSGQALSKILSNRLVEKTVNRANDFLYDLAPHTVKRQTVDIEDVALKLEGAKDEIGKIYDSYKLPVEEFAKKEGGLVLVDDTQQFLGDTFNAHGGTIAKYIKETFDYTPSGPYARELKKVLAGQEPDPKTFTWLIDNVFKEKPFGRTTFAKISPESQRNREALKNALIADLEKIAKSPKGEADKMWMEYEDFISLKKIFDKSMRDAGLGAKTIDPFKLSKNIYMAKKEVLKIDEKRAKAGLEPFWPKLEEEAKFYAELVPYFKQATANIGVRPGMMGTAGSLASAIQSGGSPIAAGWGAYQLFGPVGIPLVEGFGAISAYSMLSPLGKKAIQLAARHTTKSALKTGLHIGGQLIDFPQDIGF